jgi:hypothetical protein
MRFIWKGQNEMDDRMKRGLILGLKPCAGASVFAKILDENQELLVDEKEAVQELEAFPQAADGRAEVISW